MFKVFIVEDEHLIRESLKRNLNQLAETLPLEVVGEASDGEVALSLILEEQPDILLTDIRMPFMNGIELSQEVKKSFPATEIIFISGFDEFTYAKAAIHLQVAEYLLKPIKHDELKSSLEKVIARLEQKKQPIPVDTYSFDVQKNLFLNAIFGNQWSTSEAIEEARRLNRQIAGKKYIVLLVTNYLNKNFADYERFREKLSRLFHSEEELLFSCLSSRFIKIMIFHPNQATLLKKAEDTAIKLYSELNTGESNLVVAIGHPVERISEIENSYETAKQLLEYSVIKTKQNVLHYQDFNEQFQKYQQTLPLKEKLEQISNKELPHLVEEIIQKTEGDENPLLFRLFLLNQLNPLISERNKQSKEPFPLPSQGKLSTIVSDTLLFRTYIEQSLAFLKRTIISDSMGQYRELLEHSITYIKQHFSDSDLTLGSVATHINLSSSHFSTVFSQALGKTFIEYLTEQRLTEAKRLLKETDWKLATIASEIGYNDPNYFSYIFKRKEGLSPKEYRKKNQ